MSYLELSEKQFRKLVDELEYLGFDKAYEGGIDELKETIRDLPQYVEGSLTITDPKTGNYCRIDEFEGRLKNIEFRANQKIDLKRYNMANSRMWVYLRRVRQDA